MNSYKHANEINYNLIADNLNVLIAKLHHHLQMCALTFLHYFLIPCFVTIISYIKDIKYYITLNFCGVKFL